jgi:hypothetical protein
MFESLFGSEMPLAVRFILAFVIVSALIAGFVAIMIFAFRAPRIAPPVPSVQIAHITEHVVFSGGGAFAVAMLFLSNVALTITYLSVTNVLQQNVALLSWIGWNILWGIGAIIGRRRTYIVYRDVPPTER